MKLKIILALLSLSVIVEAQRSFVNRPHVRAALKSSWVTALDATKSQYWSGTPVAGTLDLNGGEMLPNPTFDANVTGWSGNIGGTISSAPLGRIYSGAGALRMVSDGIGNSYVSSVTISNSTANKFTQEGVCYVPSTNTSKTVRIRSFNQANSGISTADVILTPNTHTKTVLNFQATGTQTGIGASYQLLSPANGDTLYVDNASLTQSKDAVYSQAFNTTSTGVMDLLNLSKSLNPQFRFYLNNTTPTVSVSDGTNTVTATNSATVNDGKYHSYSITANRTGNLVLSIDGVAGTGVSMTGLGKILVDTVRVGRGVTTNYFTGTLGAMTFTKNGSKVWSVDWNQNKGGLTASGTPAPTTRRK